MDRRNIPPAYDEPRMMRRAPLPPTHHPMEPLPPPKLLENKLASQAAEIEQLTVDNRKLAASYLALKQDLASAKGEAEKINEHVRNIQNEGDIQIRILLDKIAISDADIGAANTRKKEIQTAHSEARKLMTAKLELSAKLEQATKELDTSHENIKKIPEMRAELDSLRREHQRLRKTFEHEKHRNTQKVEEMKNLENDMIGISEEVERLREELLHAEKKSKSNDKYPVPVPYHSSGDYTYRDNLAHCNGGAVEMMNPYPGGGLPTGNVGGGGGFPAGNVVGGGGGDGFPVGNVGSGGGGEEVYDTSMSMSKTSVER